MTIKLTGTQENFCQCVADGMTQADAYRTAYNAEKMADKTIQEAASRLMTDSKISARVAELRAALSEKLLWTREMSVERLIAAYDVAREERQATGMVSAIKELNNMHGFNEPQEAKTKAAVIQIARAEQKKLING